MFKQIFKNKKIVFLLTVSVIIISLCLYKKDSQVSYEKIRGNMLKQTSSSVKIAIVDSGISKEYINDCSDLIDFTAENNIVDKTGHGTIMYEIIHSDEWGIAPNTKISILKVTTSEGKTNVEDVIRALKWCKKNDINIVSISLSTSKDNKKLHEELIDLSQLGVHVFSSVSNSSFYHSYPAEYDEVIGVYAWRKRSFFDEVNYNYVPLNSYSVSDIVKGNSAATAFCSAMASYYLTEDNKMNKNISNTELFNKILGAMKS